MDKIRIAIILILTCLMIIGTTCLAATGIVNAPSGLVLRETPDKGAKPLTTVPDDAQVEILEVNGEWYKVKYGNYEGYLFAQYVKAQEEPKEELPEDDKKEPTNNEQVVASNNTATGTYPENINVSTQIKAYILPSITSKVIVNIEIGKTISLNYELNNWINITYEGKEYWIRKQNITYGEAKVENTEIKEEKAENQETESKEETKTEEQKVDNTVAEKNIENKKGYINVTTSANVRESASTSANVVTTLLRNAEVTITAEEGDFYKIQYQNINGYISKSLISETPLQATSRSNSQERGNIVESENKSTEVATTNNEEKNKEAQSEGVSTNAVTSSNSNGETLGEIAKQCIGKNYTYGGTNPDTGFDCSGFSQYVYNSCGISIGRTCTNQLGNGTEVSKSELQVGDLVFFNNTSDGSVGHVGVYIGDGYMVHAANSRRGVVTDTINSGYYNTYYYTARRIVN